MLNSQKILYILPNIVYVADLLATKKEYTYSIHSFRQINGHFLDDNEFVAENLSKLVDKLDEGSYQLVLPDYLFTNTIVGVKETSEQKVKSYLKENLLPSLDVDEDHFQIETFVLTQHAGEFKVQLSFLEKSVLAVLRKAIKNKKIEFSSVTSLSWTLKSIVSLEPSITVVQMGEGLFLAQQYIGLDQTSYVPVVDAENIIETVKTLKGAEPSIQTMYLLASELVEEKLRTGLASILPIQQLASFKERETDMPSYVKQAIEACARTMVVPDFILPKFEMIAGLGSAVEAELETEPAIKVEAETLEDEGDEILPAPATLGDAEDQLIGEKEAEKLKQDQLGGIAPEDEESKVMASGDEKKLDKKMEDDAEEVNAVISEDVSVDPPTTFAVETTTIKKESEITTAVDNEVIDGDIDVDRLKNFFSRENNDLAIEGDINDMSETSVTAKTVEKIAKPERKIIKDNSGLSSMLKMFFIGLASFFVTVGIGVGLGLGFLSLSGSNNDSPNQVVEVVELEPTSEPTPEPSPTPTVNKADLKVLVVNATTKAGYAGRIANLLKESEFEEVSTGNAKGDYEEGNYILGDESIKSLLNDLKADLDLELIFKTDKNIEDPRSEYDLIIVLAE